MTDKTISKRMKDRYAAKPKPVSDKFKFDLVKIDGSTSAVRCENRTCNHMYAISVLNNRIYKNNLKSELARFRIFKYKGGKRVLGAIVIAGTWMLFDFCPFCGQRIDWSRIEQELDEDFKEAKRQKAKKPLTKRP